MPSTLVHMALAGLIGVALLGENFDAKAIAIVLTATAILDLDTLIGMVLPGLHRAALHNIILPTLLFTALVWDVKLRDESYVLDRWGGYGVHVAWVTIFAVVTGHIALDLFYNGVNLFWPVHDRFYDFSGVFSISNERGIIMTFFDAEEARQGTTADTHYYTGFDPNRGETPKNVERIFPIAASGERFVLMVAGYFVIALRLLEQRWTNY